MTGTLVKAAISSTSNKREAVLWANYKETGDIGLRNELVMMYINLVEIIARKMYHVFIGKAQLDDIISNGMIALIKAVESFDPTKGIQFDTYASIRIRGSVIDYVRSQDWVPRSVREKAKKIEDSFGKLRLEYCREPTLAEIAEDLHIMQSDVEAVLCDAHAYNMMSLEEILNDRLDIFDVEDTENLSPHAFLMKKELKKILKQAIDSLSEKERMVTSLFYYEGLKIKQIAEVMEISASRVCQIHSVALIKMKAIIGEYVNM